MEKFIQGIIVKMTTRIGYSAIVCLCMEVFLPACTNTESERHQSPARQQLPDSMNFAIISLDAHADIFEHPVKPATLSQDELILIDELIHLAATEHNASLVDSLQSWFSIDFTKYSYKRQYIAGITKSGEKVVWVNAFCEASDDKWKSNIILTHDGGNCFFNLKLNLTNKSYSQLVVNGYA